MTSQSINQEKPQSQTVSPQELIAEYQINNHSETECVKKLGFIENGTGQHQSNDVYSVDGLCPTIYSQIYKAPFKFVEDCKDV